MPANNGTKIASEAVKPSLKPSSLAFFFPLPVTVAGAAEGGRRTELLDPSQIMTIALAVTWAVRKRKSQFANRTLVACGADEASVALEGATLPVLFAKAVLFSSEEDMMVFAGRHLIPAPWELVCCRQRLEECGPGVT